MNRSGSKQDLIDRISAEIENSGLPVEKHPVVAGVSGGVDSMVLLWILSVALKMQVVAVHVNYGKRGEDSLADEELVRRFCSDYDISCEVHRDLSGDDSSEMQSGNFQDHARNFRRNLLCRIMEKHEACAIFLAHHQDDQTETVFQKLLRGAAPEKWMGMVVSDPPWHRPLLGVTKQDLLNFAGARGIPYRTDATNLESGYTRNILRNEVFPLLDKSFPAWRQNIDRVARAGLRHHEMLDYVTGQVTISKPEPATGTKQRNITGLHPAMQPAADLDRDGWTALPPGLRTAVARHWIAGQSGYSGWSKGEVERLADLEHLPTGSTIDMVHGLAIMRDRDRFVILTGPSVRISHVLKRSELGSHETTLAGVSFAVDRYRQKRKGHALQLDIDALPEEMLLRTWHHGDRIRPLGMEGTQSLSDLLTNKKVSAAKKNMTLLLVSFDAKVHAVIFPHRLESGEMGIIAEHTRCHSEGQPVLLIQKPDHHS